MHHRRDAEVGEDDALGARVERIGVERDEASLCELRHDGLDGLLRDMERRGEVGDPRAAVDEEVGEDPEVSLSDRGDACLGVDERHHALAPELARSHEEDPDAVALERAEVLEALARHEAPSYLTSYGQVLLTNCSMDRLHLVELEDLAWLPAPIRDGGTDLLDLAFDRLGFYAGVAPRLDELLSSTSATSVIDLCSGGGGGTLSLWRQLPPATRARASLTLTDRYPSPTGVERVEALADPSVRYLAESVDAMTGGGAARGVRTMAGALHHFRPDAVRELLTAVVAQGAPLVFFDIAASPALRRLPLLALPVVAALNAAALFVVSLALVPLVRPARLSRLALTYLIPAIPALVAWDGTVSALRAYTPDELLALARSVPGSERYDWDAGAAGRALYLRATPRPTER